MLTEAGWPRPVIDGWPIPWVSPAHDLATMDSHRTLILVKSKLCQVCGLGHEDGTEVWLLVNEVPPKDQEGKITYAAAMDNAIMHERCMRLAIGRCPRLRALRERKEMVLLTAKIEAVRGFSADDRGLQGGLTLDELVATSPNWLGFHLADVILRNDILYPEG